MVQGSTQLRYTIELVRTGYADGGEKAIPPGDKLRRLRVLDRAWGDLGFTPSSRVKLPGPTVFYDLREGVLLRCSSSELSIIRIPTHFGTNRERRWSLGDLGLERNICASSVDPAKDLLVLIEGRDGQAPFVMTMCWFTDDPVFPQHSCTVPGSSPNHVRRKAPPRLYPPHPNPSRTLRLAPHLHHDHYA